MPSLWLIADDARWVPDNGVDFAAGLRDVGLAGDALGVGAERSVYAAGPRFVELIMFLGCFPHIALDAQAADGGQPVCRLSLHRSFDVRFICAGRFSAVRCPGCRAPARPAGVASHDSRFVCPACDAATLVTDLDWRRRAGYGRFFVEISAVYPHEAVPSEQLLEAISC